MRFERSRYLLIMLTEPCLSSLQYILHPVDSPPFTFKFLQVVRPPLHHFDPLRHVLTSMVGRPNRIFFPVGKLPLYSIGIEPDLVGNGGKECPESMHGGFRVVADPIQGIEHGIFGKGFFRIMDAGKDKTSIPMKDFRTVENGEGLL